MPTQTAFNGAFAALEASPAYQSADPEAQEAMIEATLGDLPGLVPWLGEQLGQVVKKIREWIGLTPTPSPLSKQLADWLELLFARTLPWAPEVED